MAVREILEYPHPILRQKAEPVTRFDSAVAALIADLEDTLRTTSGIGLSAPQIGGGLRVLVSDPSGERQAPEIFVNPEIIAKSAWGIVEESCLSVPDIEGKVIRATQVRVRALDRAGQPFERDLSGMDAVCLQHEIDHLDGKLFIDRLSIFRRLALRSELASRKLPSETAA